MNQHPLYLNLKTRGDFPEADFPEFLSLYRPLSVKKNAHILEAGNIARFTVFVLKGCLRQYVKSESGQEHIIYFAEENWFACDLQSMRNQIASNVNVQALKNCELLAITLGTNNQVHMPTHNTPGIYFQAFVSNAIIQACYHYIFINRMDKYIYPVNGSKRDKI